MLKKKKENKDKFIVQKRHYKKSFPTVISKIYVGSDYYFSEDGLNFKFFHKNLNIISESSVNIEDIFKAFKGRLAIHETLNLITLDKIKYLGSNEINALMNDKEEIIILWKTKK